jgi:hypothetical protein
MNEMSFEQYRVVGGERPKFDSVERHAKGCIYERNKD